MSAFKKAAIALGIALVVIPQICEAFDAKGTKVAKDLQTTYAATISASNLSNTKTDFESWQNFIKTVVDPYVRESGRFAGVEDALLIKSLNTLVTYSGVLVGDLSAVRDALVQKEADEKSILKLLRPLNDIDNKLGATLASLKREKYSLAGRKNAQEMLLLALNRSQQTAEKAIEKLTAKLQKRH